MLHCGMRNYRRKKLDSLYFIGAAASDAGGEAWDESVTNSKIRTVDCKLLSVFQDASFSGSFSNTSYPRLKHEYRWFSPF